MPARDFYRGLTDKRRTAARMMFRAQGASEPEICRRLGLRSYDGTIREIRQRAQAFGIRAEVTRGGDGRQRTRLREADPPEAAPAGADGQAAGPESPRPRRPRRKRDPEGDGPPAAEAA